MKHDQDSRLLLIGSMLAAFVLGVVFAVIAMGLRPRVALAPAPPELEPQPRPGSQPKLMRATKGSGPADSVPGDGTHNVPNGFPIKGNNRSGIYHLPGALAYDRTIATIYFRSPGAAEAAGFRRSKT